MVDWLGQYVFETEGTHEVEIELTDNSPTDMLFARVLCFKYNIYEKYKIN